VSNPRGFLIESQAPSTWIGTAAEHSFLYQYNISGATNVTLVLTQTESPYEQVPVTAWAVTIQDSTWISWTGGMAYNWFNGNQTYLVSVNTTASLDAYLINVHGTNTVWTGDVGTIPAYSPVEEEWFCDGFSAYTGA
jgi:hypothetical protein